MSYTTRYKCYATFKRWHIIETLVCHMLTMHFYLKSLEFAALYTKLFMDQVNPSASKWKVFGVPHYSALSYMATTGMYRCISLKTVAIEAEVSQSHDVR